MKRATLHNEDEITRLDVRVGDRVLIEKPVRLFRKSLRFWIRIRSAKPRFEMPSLCPECNTELRREEGEVVLRCENLKCPGQLKERLLHFGSRNAMDIDHLGEAVVAQLIAQCGVKQFSDLYRLNLEQVRNLDRLGKSPEKTCWLRLRKVKEQVYPVLSSDLVSGMSGSVSPRCWQPLLVR